MNVLYRSISKQAFHQKMNRELVIKSEQGQLLLLIYQIRENHPTMGIRDMYYKLKPENIGRDAFESFCKQEGLLSERAKNWYRTTDSSGVVRFDNLLIDLKIYRINQVWQSDITYFEVNQRFYYITFIIESFTRRVIGWNTSKRLTTEQTTLPALKMAVKKRKKAKQAVGGVIIHSDGDGQYYDKEFLKFTGENKMINSMANMLGKMERRKGSTG